MKINKIAFITGISGQLGSYMSEILLKEGYEVHGLIRDNNLESLWRINHIKDRLFLHVGDIRNFPILSKILSIIRPEECYHFAAQPFIKTSFIDPFTTFDININGTLNLLESIRISIPECKIFFASSAEMFGISKFAPQEESTPFNPRNPFGISKVTGFNLIKNYRDTYNMFAVSGIIFNGESYRRGKEYITKKITDYVSGIRIGLKLNPLRIGNLKTIKDWIHAKDVCNAIYLIMQQKSPIDLIISGGIGRTLIDFLNVSFGIIGEDWSKHIIRDISTYTRDDAVRLIGNYELIGKITGWYPEISFEDMIKDMVNQGSVVNNVS